MRSMTIAMTIHCDSEMRRRRPGRGAGATGPGIVAGVLT